MGEIFSPSGWEKKLAAILSFNGIQACRPTVGTQYSDILISPKNGPDCWIEVKMSHNDNLSNPRVFYDGEMWKTNYETKVAEEAIRLLNSSSMTKDFIKSISSYSKIKIPKIPTTKLGLKEKNAVPLEVMRSFFNQPYVNRYILLVDDYDIGKIVREHYLTGKKEPVYYLQAGDDFYKLIEEDPLHLPQDIPIFGGTGTFKVRVSTRSKFYEVQTEIKIHHTIESPYSILCDISKKNPFERIK